MDDSAQSRHGISTRAVEIVVAATIFLLGAVVVYDSFRLGASWASDGPQAGYFPFYIGVIICSCATMILLHAVVGKHAGPPVFVTWVALKRVMQVLGPAAVYVLGIQVIGIYLAAAAYIAIFMFWLGRYSMVVAAAVGVGVMTIFFLMFEVWFKVPLYKGLLDPLAFLGY
ncbi:MAG: tripartite tricarboxylate transporter TctB family protein [Betaproteobacteria bacterium]|nr:tripartite tricarboxylate transporter TctB family protein [Betaproteobacteria bacterium]